MGVRGDDVEGIRRQDVHNGCAAERPLFEEAFILRGLYFERHLFEERTVSVVVQLVEYLCSQQAVLLRDLAHHGQQHHHELA